MSNILNSLGNKVATIGEDGMVHNLAGVKIGHISEDSHAYNNSGIRVGYFDSKGYVYKGTNHIGTIHSDGKIYDYNNHYLGKVVGDHIESGGAALLLLVR